MTGYTRQSTGSIQNTLDITAAPLNAEFNQVQSAFGTAGHSHDGTAGNGPKVPLATSVSGYLLAANGGYGGKNNTTATANPTATNDVDEGYAVGSHWVNVTTGRLWICVGNSDGAAVWRSQAHISQADDAIMPDIDGTSSSGIGLGTVNKRFKNMFLSAGASIVGNLVVGGTVNCTSLTQTSDYRAKRIDGDMYLAEDDIKSVSPMMATLHNEATSRPQFIAHELQDICPWAVQGDKDAVDENGNPIYQTVNYSALIPLMWAAIQEAYDKIEDLENRTECSCE